MAWRWLCRCTSADQLIAEEPTSSHGYILRAAARLGQQDQAGAETDLRKSLDLAPQSPVGYYRLGGLRLAQKRYSEAEKMFEQALALDPNYQEALQGLVGVSLEQKQAPQALARVKEQISKVPNNSSYYFLEGALLYRSRDTDGAQAALEKAVEMDNNNQSAVLLLGQLLMARGLGDQAIARYQKSIQQNPQDVRTYVMLASIENVRGNWKAAEDLYQRAMTVQPDYPLAANNLANLMLDHGGSVDIALSLAEVARKGMPDSPMSADTLGKAYCQKGVYGIGIDLLEEAVKKEPNNAAYHYHLGTAYEKARDLTRAKQHFQKALQLDPNDPRDAQIRAALSQVMTQ
jgi:tetratricopeptide (TPR) repeat protein